MSEPLNKSYSQTFTLLTRDCDFTGHWRPSAVLEAMQEAAGVHCALLGCGRDDLLKQDTVWVLSRCEIHMNRYPILGEQLTVSTYPMPVRRYFFPRYYVFTDGHGELIGSAGSLWLLLDLHTRHMLPPGNVARLIPDNKDLSIPAFLPATVGALQGDEFVTEYRPVYTDLDVNGHVNNTRYADWLCNALGISLMQGWEPESLILNYNAEILPGSKVTLHRILRDQDFRFSARVGDKTAFEAGGRLRPRV